MRKIALIMDGWKRFCTYAWPAGILQRIHETDEAVNLYIFNSSGNWSSDEIYNMGEYNIYNLPDLKEFDGIILELNNISSRKVLQDVVQRAKSAGVPVLSIANELEDFYYVGIDNYQAMKDVIAHLHQKHNCKKFWFIMGPEGNYENVLRTNALKDYMKECNLPYSEEDFYHGDFDYRSGVQSFKKLMDIHEGKPDAIICVNDNIAVAVCETAKEYGYRVPEDFCVTGFDNFDKASYYVPSITTAGHVREEAGYMCADILLRLWNGEEVSRLNYTSVQPVYQESCGCNSGTKRDIRAYLRDQIMYGIESDEFAAEVLALESEMMQCSTVEEMMYCIPQCIPSLKCDAMYLVLDEHISTYKKELEKQIWANVLPEEDFCETGYPSTLQVKFAYEKDGRLEQENKEISGIFPMFDSPESGKDFLFIPLHFGGNTIGFFVIKNAVYLMEKQYIFRVINALTGAMENLHKKERLEYMNRRLSNLYMMDPLTGMYNRMGYQKLGENFYNIFHAKRQRVLIMFIDLDGLKYINDTFGHEYGDAAICTTANAIVKYCDEDAVPARTGGDEYVLVQGYESEEATGKLLENIRRELAWEGKKKGFPFTLGISVGSIVTDPESSLTMADYVKLADSRMYEKK
ncbi:MAG: GGDEF domain-containing protein [Lachnospiraceae bacterium]|nr:GGDEF domain-containing protein [Lachnospiraceae bacterium]